MDNKTVFFDESSQLGENGVLVVFNKNCVISVNKLKQLTSIGRMTAQSRCDISLNSPIVSRAHGEIQALNGEYYYRDLGSTNGTYINNCLYGKSSPIGRQACKLKNGDIFCFDIRQNGRYRADRIFALFCTMESASLPWNRLRLDPGIAEICIGRAEDSGMKIENDMISKHHASFFLSGNRWAIVDHGSTNGTYLNGKRMGAPEWLNEFDTVRIVDTYFIYTGEYLLYSSSVLNSPQDESAAPISRPVTEEIRSGSKPVITQNQNRKTNNGDVNNYNPERDNAVSGGYIQQGGLAQQNDFQSNPQHDRSANTGSVGKMSPASGGNQLCINITERSVVSRFKKLMLLQDINLTINNGEFVLILGGSGAGKTTFLNAVMGYEKAKAQISYRNNDIYRQYERMKYEIGFVPQENLLRNSDFVYDTLLNSAQMKLPSNISSAEIERRIDDVLSLFNLENQKHSLVSKLSGGQKRRLNIAVEYIGNPNLFFLDEPDSGVDAKGGQKIMKQLRTIADRGKIVMIITHSPQNGQQYFDKVVVLAKSPKDNCGHLAFCGPIDQAFKFFDTDNFNGILERIEYSNETKTNTADYYIEKFAKINH